MFRGKSRPLNVEFNFFSEDLKFDEARKNVTSLSFYQKQNAHVQKTPFQGVYLLQARENHNGLRGRNNRTSNLFTRNISLLFNFCLTDAKRVTYKISSLIEMPLSVENVTGDDILV